MSHEPDIDTGCIYCGSEQKDLADDNKLETVQCGRCGEDFLCCTNCDESLCDYCKHVSDKDD